MIKGPPTHTSTRRSNSSGNSCFPKLLIDGRSLDTKSQEATADMGNYSCKMHLLVNLATESDCVIANIVLQVNKLRYKDGKGDPKGFQTFLQDNNLPKGLIHVPRYRGNRLHILFHIISHYELFLDFFSLGSVTCGGLA